MTRISINANGSESRNSDIIDKNPSMQGGMKSEVQDEVLSRLKKIEGQVRGVQKMIQDCRICGDIVTQLTAIKAAVNRVGFTMLACHLADQIEKDLHEGKNVKSSLNEFITAFKKFS